MILVLPFFTGCAGESGLEGRVVDGRGRAMAHLKIIAKQLEPVPGYEKFETLTDREGAFRFTGLLPGAAYVLKPRSSQWTPDASRTLETGPRGKTITLSAPLVVRFTLNRDSLVSDSRTGLEWAVGPDRPTSQEEAGNWVKNLDMAGHGWRMPSPLDLESLVQGDGRYQFPLSSLFKTSGWMAWGGTGGGFSVFDLSQGYLGGAETAARDSRKACRAFAVRSKKPGSPSRTEKGA